LGRGYQWEGEECGKMVKEGKNTVCTCVYMEKMRPVDTIPAIREERIKKNNGGGELKNDIFDDIL
jgi:hypothetical protein